MVPATISIQNIHYQYEDGNDVLSALSLEVHTGERLAILGKNGSGKTTLIKHLNGLLRPASGTIEIGGKSTGTFTVAQLASMVALQFQNPDNQICKSTVWDEAAFGPRNIGYSEERVRACTEASLATFELLPKKDCNPHDLGFSDRKLLSIASVLAMDTDIIVLDEPTAGLDPHEQALLVSALDSLTAGGKTVLVVSHDMDFVAENLERAVYLDEGRIQFDGTVQDLFQHHVVSGNSELLLPQIFRLSTHFNLALEKLTPECFIEAFASSKKLSAESSSVQAANRT